MHYIIGPERSAEALARKVGLRREEWALVRGPRDLSGVDLSGQHRFLETHDAWQLGEYDGVVAAVNRSTVSLEWSPLPESVVTAILELWCSDQKIIPG